MTKLVDGCVPAFTDCPYRKECGDYGQNYCLQEGVKHNVPFSCAIARSYEIEFERKVRV